MNMNAPGCILEGISTEGADLLLRYPWPGNIREMRNFCQRICILSQVPLAGPADILRVLPDAAGITKQPVPSQVLEEIPPSYSPYDEREEILKALCTFHNNRSKTAEFLGIDKSTLWRKMKKYKIIVR